MTRLLLLGLLCWSSPLFAQNLLVNGGWESGLLAPWTGASTAEVVPLAAHGSALGLHLPSAQLVTQAWVPVMPGRTYALTAWFRWTAFDGSDWGYDVLGVISDEWRQEAALTHLHERFPQGVWNKIGLTFVPTRPAVQVQFGVEGPQTTVAQDWDDLSLFEKTGNLPPIVAPSAMPTFGSAPLTVAFQANADDPDGGLNHIQWEFGDGGRFDGDAAGRTYTATGVYRPEVSVWDNEHAKTTWATTVEVTSDDLPWFSDVVITDGPDPPPVVQPSAPVVTVTQTPVVLPSATTQVLWQHPYGSDGIPVDAFTYLLDSAPAVDVGTPVETQATPLSTFAIPFPRATTPGTHVLIVQACNQAGCADSDPVTVEVARTDSPPSTPFQVMVLGSNGINTSLYTYNPTLVWFANADQLIACPADRCVAGYRIEVWVAGTDLTTGSPLTSTILRTENVQPSHDAGMPWQAALNIPVGLPVGTSYVVRLVTLGEGWNSGRSDPSNLFRFNACAGEGRGGVTPMTITVTPPTNWRVGGFGPLQVAVSSVNKTHAISVDFTGDSQPAWYFIVPEASPVQTYFVGPLKRAGHWWLNVTARDERGCEITSTQGIYVTVAQ